MSRKKEDNIFIRFKNTSFEYRLEDKNAKNSINNFKVLENINLTIKNGEYIAIVGRNGSGKSTFAKLINALLLPTTGNVYIDNLDSKDENNIWEIRQKCGIIFQNPDNQIVGTTVEEDIAFGLENLGVLPKIIEKKIIESLDIIEMQEYRMHAPNLLSGGQKQKIAIAGILAMNPKCIILDEATSMLDPISRKEILYLLKRLNTQENITIINITHSISEAILADRVIIIDEGKIKIDDKTNKVFSDIEKIKNLGLDVPQITELFYNLNKDGFFINFSTILNSEEGFLCIENFIKNKKIK